MNTVFLNISKERSYSYSGGADLSNVGNFSMPAWKGETGILTDPDEYDFTVLKDAKLKPDERIFRYETDRCKIAKIRPFIKINMITGLVYFLTPEASDEGVVEFETRGTRAQYINLFGGRK